MLTVGTFNIRCDWTPHGPTAWTVRREGVRDLIRSVGFDVLGVQEAFAHQADFLIEPGRWEYVGVGRDDGDRAGEFAAIFFNPRRLEVLASGSFWLSETPDRPSFSWDAACIRICTWARFRDREATDPTAADFTFFNCHLDHVGTIARQKSAELLLRRVQAAVAESGPDAHIFLVGDFNMTVEDQPIQTIAASLINGVALGNAEPPVATFTGFDPADAIGLPIDHVFVSASVLLRRYEVLPNQNESGLLISDHRPVVVTIDFHPQSPR